MKADGFAWWKRRFAQMSNYFDAFRIDHVLGFFRIWSIPAHAVEGILGYFVPAIPVDAGEFAARGIAFDRDRFTQPFITDAVLREIFGRRKRNRPPRIFGGGRQRHLFVETRIRDADGRWKNILPRSRPNERNAKLKTGLFDLISNVILFEAEARGRHFHFRFAMEQTSSFKYLPPETQARLRELYVDYFFRRQDDFWMREAMQKLPALKRVTNMLVCGEDLGLVPACVPDVHEATGFVEPGNSAHAQGARPGIFPPGGRAVSQRGHALDARHEHHSRLVGGRRATDAEILQRRNSASRAKRRANANRGSTRPSCASISRHRRCGASSSCRTCWAWTSSLRRADVARRTHQRACHSAIITGATGCT